jgi:rhodanese-related sulfurtransferase
MSPTPGLIPATISVRSFRSSAGASFLVIDLIKKNAGWLPATVHGADPGLVGEGRVAAAALVESLCPGAQWTDVKTPEWNLGALLTWSSVKHLQDFWTPESRVTLLSDEKSGILAIPAHDDSYSSWQGFEEELSSHSVLSPEKLAHKIKSKALGELHLDLREAEELGQGRIEGSTWLPFSRLLEELLRGNPALAPSRRVILSCGVGRQSLAAARTLAAFGFRDVVVLKGGFLLWQQSGYPVVLL